MIAYRHKRCIIIGVNHLGMAPPVSPISKITLSRHMALVNIVIAEILISYTEEQIRVR